MSAIEFEPLESLVGAVRDNEEWISFLPIIDPETVRGIELSRPLATGADLADPFSVGIIAMDRVGPISIS